MSAISYETPEQATAKLLGATGVDRAPPGPSRLRRRTRRCLGCSLAPRIGAKMTLGETMSDSRTRPEAVHAVTAAVKELNPRQRQARWGHLSLCVLDGTFSINAAYDSTVAPLVHRYADWAGLPQVLLRGEELSAVVSPRENEQRLSAFLDSHSGRTDAEFAAEVLRNRGRTSTRNGILKSEAARRIAYALVEEEVETLADVSALLQDLERLKVVEAKLARIPGSGTSGVRTGYIWMTAGDDHTVKPDRHILAWLASIMECKVTVSAARAILADVAEELDLTPWAIDHAIWQHMARRRHRRTRS